jgi:predicted negative regulator of RcsB-dependent stress response
MPSPYVILGVLVVVLGLFGWAMWERSARYETLAAWRTEVAEVNAQSAKRLNEAVARERKVREAEAKKLQLRTEELNKLLGEVERGEDGPIADSLRRALDGLRAK